MLVIFEEEVLCYVVVVEVKENMVLSIGVVEGLEVDQHFSEFGSYYTSFICYNFQSGLVIFRSGEVGIK